MSDEVDLAREQGNDFTRNYDLEGACFQNDLRPPRTQGLVHKQRLPAVAPHVTQGIFILFLFFFYSLVVRC